MDYTSDGAQHITNMNFGNIKWIKVFIWCFSLYYIYWIQHINVLLIGSGIELPGSHNVPLSSIFLRGMQHEDSEALLLNNGGHSESRVDVETIFIIAKEGGFTQTELHAIISTYH